MRIVAMANVTNTYSSIKSRKYPKRSTKVKMLDFSSIGIIWVRVDYKELHKKHLREGNV